MASQAGYPIFVDLAGRPVLLVGAGQVGLRKARGLVEAGARLTVVSLRFAEGFAALAGIEAIVGPYQGGLIRREKWRLVFAAADVKEVNEAVQRDAAAAGVLCCRCDEQESGDFSGGAIGHIGGVTVAISTRGASPALSRRIREQALARSIRCSRRSPNCWKAGGPLSRSAWRMRRRGARCCCGFPARKWRPACAPAARPAHGALPALAHRDPARRRTGAAIPHHQV